MRSLNFLALSSQTEMWFWVLLTIVLGGILAARHFAQRYHTTKPPAGKKPRQFANRANGPSLSIVIPCYNEEERLPPMLKETIAFCDKTVKACVSDDAARSEGLFSDYEILVVDDCSKDRTIAVAEQIASEAPREVADRIRIVRVNPNHGKGYAVRSGFFEASGDYVLMADGDNATKIDDVRALFKALRKPTAAGTAAPVIAIGSRAHLEEASMAQRTFLRTVLMKAFHLVVAVTYFMGTLGSVCHLRDTQCGFKLFNRRVCSDLFLNNRLERWAFDVELLLLARRFALGVVEVQVNWSEIPGSKVNLKGMAQMGLECVLMCVAYPLQFWPIRT